MQTISPATAETLALRLAARTGLRTTTCRTVLGGNHRKYSHRIRLRALDGIRGIIATGQTQPQSDTANFLGNLASAIATGLTQFGTNFTKAVVAGVAATVTSGSEGGEGDSDGGDTGEEEEGEEK